MWDHVRGNDTDASGRLLMGRAGWFDEVMRFYDRHVKGATVADDPANIVQTSDGSWRAEESWPPADSQATTVALNPGEYTDDAQNEGTGSGTTGQGIWTISPRLTQDAHFAGVPKVTVDVARAPQDANLVVDVYDLDSGRNATLISRGAYLLSGNELVTMDLYGDDWKIPAGHRVGVLVTGANAEWWVHVPDRRDRERARRADRTAVPALHPHGDAAGRSVGEARGLPGGRAVHRPIGDSERRRTRRLRGSVDRRMLSAILELCPHPTTSWPTPRSGRRSPRSPSATATT